MDWTLALRRNRGALERVLAALFVLAGLEESGPEGHARTATLPRHLHAHVLRILRAAAAAIRRPIVISAREVTVLPRQMLALSLSAALNAEMAETKFGVFRM